MDGTELECETHNMSEDEHEFYRAFVVILEHLKNRALKAEAEVIQLRLELKVRREQVEYMEKPGTVEAERERCARIADQLARANANLNDGDDAPAAHAAAQFIAKEIRETDAFLSAQ